ncbi:MAG: GAF domain-containing sensor histidine kinase [Brevefilum sp.]
MSIETKIAGKGLKERLADLHHASLDLVQDISIDTLLPRIARIASEQIGVTYTAVAVRGENGKIERFITAGMNGAEEASVEPPSWDPDLLGVIANADGPIRVDYIKKDTRRTGFPGDLPRTTSLLGVPIHLAERQLGQIYLTDKMDESLFTEDDERVMETLADYAAVAISNARSYNELRQRDRTITRRNQDLALLNNLASALASITELDELLKAALTHVINYFNVDVGEIFLSEEDHNTLYKILQKGNTGQSIWTQDRFTLKEALIGQTARTGQHSVVILPYKEDPYLQNEALLEAGINQIACFPLTSRSEVLGVLSIALSQKKPLDTMDQQLLTSIASWVGTTIENVRLNIQGRRLAVLEERERIGMDLHDGIIQSIYAVGLTLEHARLLLGDEPEQTRKRIDQSIEDLNSTIRNLRSFIMDMRPRQLYEENLMDGLQRLINEFRANSLVEAKLSGPSDGLEELPDAHAIALFHICQEALANVAKHASADHVEVTVWTTSDRVLMEVNDDGQGFDPQKIQFTLGHGISNMQTRARNVGGDLEITTEPEEGTTIMAWMPYSQDLDRKTLE